MNEYQEKEVLAAVTFMAEKFKDELGEYPQSFTWWLQERCRELVEEREVNMAIETLKNHGITKWEHVKGLPPCGSTRKENNNE